MPHDMIIKLNFPTRPVGSLTHNTCEHLISGRSFNNAGTLRRLKIGHQFGSKISFAGPLASGPRPRALASGPRPLALARAVSPRPRGLGPRATSPGLGPRAQGPGAAGTGLRPGTVSRAGLAKIILPRSWWLSIIGQHSLSL